MLVQRIKELPGLCHLYVSVPAQTGMETSPSCFGYLSDRKWGVHCVCFFFFLSRGSLSLVSVPSPSFPISSHRAIVAGVMVTAFGHFRIWLHNQRDPSLVSCIDFMLALYSQSPPAEEVLLHCIGCHRALVGHCVSPGMSKDYNEKRALLGGACVG